MVLCDGSYPKILAFSYLFEIQKEFLDNYTHNEIQSAVRPYPYLTFGMLFFFYVIAIIIIIIIIIIIKKQIFKRPKKDT